AEEEPERNARERDLDVTPELAGEPEIAQRLRHRRGRRQKIPRRDAEARERFPERQQQQRQHESDDDALSRRATHARSQTHCRASATTRVMYCGSMSASAVL